MLLCEGTQAQSSACQKPEKEKTLPKSLANAEAGMVGATTEGVAWDSGGLVGVWEGSWWDAGGGAAASPPGYPCSMRLLTHG